MDRDKKL